MEKPKFGATGKFPMPAISDDDEGELRGGVAFDPTMGLVRVEFGKPVAWLALTPSDAINLARSLLKAAGAKKVEISF